MIYLNNKKIQDVYLGDKKIAKIYKGDNLVYESNQQYFKILCSYNQANLVINGSSTIIDLVKDNISKVKVNDILTTCNKMFSSGFWKNGEIQAIDQQKLNGIKKVDISHLDLSNCTDISEMFFYSQGIEEIIFGNIDTSKVISMYNMFCACFSLTVLDLSLFDTSNVENMSSMFTSCVAITSLNLSNFNTSKVTNVSGMFNQCINLTYLDLSNFDLSHIKNSTNYSRMFYNCPKINHIKCKQAFKDWCLARSGSLYLPTTMKDGGTGVWEIVDDEMGGW